MELSLETTVLPVSFWVCWRGTQVGKKGKNGWGQGRVGEHHKGEKREKEKAGIPI